MLILAAILAIFVYGMVAAMFGTTIPGLARNLNLDNVQAGWIFTWQALGLTVASISVGPLIDNKGKKVGLLLGLGLVAVALAGLANASSYNMAAGFGFLLGIGGGVIVTGGNTLISDINPARRGTVMNFMNLFFGLGGLVTPLIASDLLDQDPVRVFYAGAILTAFTFLFHSATKMPPPTGERGFNSSEMGALLGQPKLFMLALFLFLYVACEVGVWNWLQKHLIAQGVPEQNALRILSLGFALGLLLGRVAVAPVLIKIPAATVTLAASVMMAFTTYGMLQTTDATGAGIAVFLAGVAMAPVFPTTLAMVGGAFPKATATAMGIVITSGWIGLVVSSPIIGGIAGSSGLGTALMILPAFSVAMIVVNLALRPMLAKN